MVELMNLMNDLFLTTDSRHASFFERSRLPIASVWERNVIQFYKLFAYWFFVLKKWQYFGKDGIETLSGSFPVKLVFSRRIFGLSIDKINGSAKSWLDPIKDLSLRVVELKNSLVQKIGSIFGLILLHAKIAFGINKACEVCKILVGRLYGFIDFFKPCDVFDRHKVIFPPILSKLFDNLISFFSKRGGEIGTEELAHRLFFNKIWLDGFSNGKRRLSSYGIVMKRLMSRVSMFLCVTNTASKALYKVKENFWVRRAYVYSTASFACVFANCEAAVTIDVARKVQEVYSVECCHGSHDTHLSHLKQQKMDNPTELNRTDIDAVVQTLLTNNAMMISDNMEGSLKFGTSPVREAFWAMMHTAILDDLESVTGFISQAQYPNNMNTLDAEWGSVGNVRFTYSSRGSTTAAASLNGATVYNVFVTGQEAYADIKLTNATANFIYTPPGGPTDPLRRLQLGAYKLAKAPRIMNDAWIFNLRCTHSV